MQGKDDALSGAVAVMSDTAKALMTLRSEMENREKRMHAVIDQDLQSLRNEVLEAQRGITAIVQGAQARITEEAKAAMGPVVTEYGRAMQSTSSTLRNAGKTVWGLYAGLITLAVLVFMVAWAVLGYYRRELLEVQDELARYDNAVPVLKAFYASDAVLCDDRICVNVDQNGQRRGKSQEYAPAKLRK